MKRLKYLTLLLLLMTAFAVTLSLIIVRRDRYEVVKGFSYGAPQSQITTTVRGTFTVNRYGFPSTYREQQTFTPHGDIFNESTYELHKIDGLYVLTNIIFWMGLFVALLAPLTIFYHPKKEAKGKQNQQPQSDITKTEMPSESKAN